MMGARFKDFGKIYLSEMQAFIRKGFNKYEDPLEIAFIIKHRIAINYT